MAHILVAVISFDVAYGGGGARVATDVSEELSRLGHKISVICYDYAGNLPEHEERGSITIYRYRLASSPTGIVFPQDHLVAASRILSKHGLSNPPDVIHGYSPFQFVAALNTFPSVTRSLYTILSPMSLELDIGWRKQGLRGQIKRVLGMRKIRALETECYRRAAVLTAHSNYTVSLIRSSSGPTVAQRINVVPGWTDLERFQILDDCVREKIRRDLHWPVDQPVFFALRRLEPRMGLENLLLAVADLKAEGLQFHVAIGGRGSLLPKLESLCRDLHLAETVSFLGFVPEHLLPQAYAASEATVVPTSALECFGLIVLESLACGRPALVTPVGSLPELVERFEPRWIAAGAGHEEIGALMREFLSGKLASHSPEQMRAFVEANYDPGRIALQYERLLLNPA